MTDHSDLIDRITRYLATGGLFNPELANHDAVRDLLIESRDALSSQSLSLSEAKEERDEARQIVRAIYWMALRYADGRQTYAPGMCNDALRKAYDAGWLVHRHQSDPAFARDGASPEYRRLDAEPALENGPAVLADATSNPPLPDLSSLRKGAEVAVARVKALEDRYEDWRLVSHPPHEVQIQSGEMLNFYRDNEDGTYWNGTWEDRRDADLWCRLVTASINDRALAALVSGSREDGDAKP